MNPNENQNLNQPLQPEAPQPQAPVPSIQAPPMQVPPIGPNIAPIAAAGTAAGSSILTWIIVAVISVTVIGGGIGGFVYYRNNYGNSSTIAENTLSNDENAKLIKENVDAYFKAQKEKDVKGVEKYLPQEITSEELTTNYLNSYFKDSEEKISAVELKNVDFDTDKFDSRADNFVNYPAKNKAIISVSLTRNTNYLGAETRTVYEIPVVYRKSWKVVATDTLMPKQLKTVSVGKENFYNSDKIWPFTPGGEMGISQKVTKVAVFDKHIVIKVEMETKSPDLVKIVGLDISVSSLIDDGDQTYTYQRDFNTYPSSGPQNMASNAVGKSAGWFSFASSDLHTIGKGINRLTYNYRVTLTNFSVEERQKNVSDSIEIDMK